MGAQPTRVHGPTVQLPTDEKPQAEACPRCGGLMRPVAVAGPHMTIGWRIDRWGADGCCTDCAFMDGAA